MTDTVNKIYFARVVFSQKFGNMKREITLPLTDVGKYAPVPILLPRKYVF